MNDTSKQKLRHRPVLKKEELVYVDEPLSRMKRKADAATQDPSRKLISTKIRLSKALQVRSHTVTVDINGIHNAVSIDRIALAKTAEEATPATEAERHVDVPRRASNTEDEYFVERIVCHTDDYNEANYLVRQYGYSTADDTQCPSRHIRQHFICRYWERQQRVEQRSTQITARN